MSNNVCTIYAGADMTTIIIVEDWRKVTLVIVMKLLQILSLKKWSGCLLKLKLQEHTKTR